MKKTFLLLSIGTLICLISFSQQRNFADFNGDGKTDKITYTITDDIHHICDLFIYLGTSYGYSNDPIKIIGIDYGAPNYPYNFTDINGDGMADFVTYRGGGKESNGRMEKMIYLSTGKGLDRENPILTNLDGGITFQLEVRQLCCNKTTESGADEVYIMVMMQGDDKSNKYFDRVPPSHWDMNDGDQPTNNPNGDSHCITQRPLYYGDLKDGETKWFNIVVSEEDGGNTSGYQAAASSLLIKTGNPYAVGAGIVIGALTELGFSITDSDDWMGMFGVKVTNNHGQMSVVWVPKDGVAGSHSNIMQPNADFTLTHDGSNYTGSFVVRKL